jgi:HK97 family phage major capsid protein
MNLEELHKKYAALIAQARQLADQFQGKEMPKETATQIEGILGQADEAKAQIDLAERLAAGEAFLNEPTTAKAANATWRQTLTPEGNVPVDEKAWREAEIVNPLGERKTLRYQVPIAVQAKTYPSAFEAYLRKGRDGMGPSDRKTLSEGVDNAGGFLVPEDMQASILKKVALVAVMRSRARVITTSRDMVKWPKVVYNTDDKYTSGVRLTWTGETPASTTVHRVTDPVFGEEQIPVHTAMASLPLTNDLLEDAAFDVLGLSSELMGEAFGLGEDNIFINGTGAGQPQGLLNHPNASVIYTTAGGMYVKTASAAALTAGGLIDIETRLPAQYERNAVWLLNKATKGAIRKLVDSANAYLFPQYIMAGPLASGPVPEQLMGYPIAKNEFMPDIAANAFPIIFGDLSGYLVADRVGLSIQVLRELYAETNIALVLARKRVGGQLVESYRLRTQKCEA